MMEMNMYFYQSVKVHFIFESLKITTLYGYLLCIAVTFLIGILIEYINLLKHNFQEI